jgi:hypothetical protein
MRNAVPSCRHAAVFVLALCAAILFEQFDKYVSASSGKPAVRQSSPTEYRSRNFLVHTDLEKDDATELLGKLETMLKIITRYWGAPMRRHVECYVVQDINNWSAANLPPEARLIVQRGGITTAQGTQRGTRLNLTATVYASSLFGTPQHEAVHAYCYQAFGRTGPTWYAEGMAEMGNYWIDGQATVSAPEYVVQFLNASRYKSVRQITDDASGTGDGWRNYAWRWALCHFLVNNSNYNERFRVLGVGFLAGRRGSFQRTYAAKLRELEFEFQFFVDHLQRGFNVSLCSWDWKAKYRLQSGTRPVTARIKADQGWQPSRLRVEKGKTYRVASDGNWSAGTDGECTADGHATGVGQLTGILFDDYELSAEFPLGVDQTFTASGDGLLLLRCNQAWNALDDNSGTLSVESFAADGG